jgi:hypothetical protein
MAASEENLRTVPAKALNDFLSEYWFSKQLICCSAPVDFRHLNQLWKSDHKHQKNLEKKHGKITKYIWRWIHSPWSQSRDDHSDDQINLLQHAVHPFLHNPK